MKRKESKKNKMERDFSYEGRKLALNDPETLKVELDGLISIGAGFLWLTQGQSLHV